MQVKIDNSPIEDVISIGASVSHSLFTKRDGAVEQLERMGRVNWAMAQRRIRVVQCRW